MSIGRLLKKIMELPPKGAGEIVVPDPAVVGLDIRWARELRRWKKSALATLADVSLSTVERIERGERITDESLKRIDRHLAIRLAPSPPRDQLCLKKKPLRISANCLCRWSTSTSRPSHERQLRALANCHSYLPYLVDVSDEAKPSVLNFIEWLDLAASS